ncbi:uncharacterized protein LOC106657001 [Trichogramma pretiosum]|uniref:uncharacterized protein LOC106657001 n=1 Tax=Trichogramma pretiosum TaxID=7493 RepID=UPI0006C9DBD7|nr:uncharacterized protein LOC106657001 [Trichogramma pretiosum]
MVHPTQEVELVAPTIIAVHESKLSRNWRWGITHNVNMYRRLLHWLFANYNDIELPSPEDAKPAYSLEITSSQEQSLYDFVFLNAKMDIETCRRRISVIAPHWTNVLRHVEAMRSKCDPDQVPKDYLETVYPPHFTFMRTCYMRLIERWFDICYSPDDIFKLSPNTKKKLNEFLDKINIDTKQMPKIPLQLIKICNFSKKLVSSLTCNWPVFLKKFFFLDFCYIFRKGKMPALVYQPPSLTRECANPTGEVKVKINFHEMNKLYNSSKSKKQNNRSINNSSSQCKTVASTNLRRSKRYQFNPFESDDKSLLKHLLPPESLAANPATNTEESSTSAENMILSSPASLTLNVSPSTEQVTCLRQQQPAVSSTVINSTTNSSPNITSCAESLNKKTNSSKKRKIDYSDHSNNSSDDDNSSYSNDDQSIVEEETISHDSTYNNNSTISETPHPSKRKVPRLKLDSSLKRNIFSCNSVSTSAIADKEEAANSKHGDDVSAKETMKQVIENVESIEDDDVIFLNQTRNNSNTIEDENLKSFLSSGWFDQVWSPGMDKYLMRYICANPVCLEELNCVQLHNKLLAAYPDIFNGTNSETLRHRVGFLANSERLKKLCGYNNIKSQKEKQIFESKLVKLREWMNEFGENFSLLYI